jgi:ribonuclease HII
MLTFARFSGTLYSLECLVSPSLNGRTVPYLIGIDEAGYGPNLGPLVICATVWHIPEKLAADLAVCDLYHHLAEAVHPGPHLERLAIADSKKLYAGGKGLRLLEEGIWAVAPLVGHTIPFWADPEFAYSDDSPLAPWYRQPMPLAPQAVQDSVIEAKRRLFQTACGACEVRLCKVAVVAITAARFNQQVAHWGKKSDVLSHATLGLLRKCLDAIDLEPTVVICDKHGGRSRYMALLQHHFPDWQIRTEQESRPCSRYRCQREFEQPGTANIEIHFQSKGEGFLPAALASMFAKYHRELAMAAFNQFWISHLPSVRPTAGYPVDALRFADEVAPIREKLRIAAADFWRLK